RARGTPFERAPTKSVETTPNDAARRIETAPSKTARSETQQSETQHSETQQSQRAQSETQQGDRAQSETQQGDRAQSKTARSDAALADTELELTEDQTSSSVVMKLSSGDFEVASPGEQTTIDPPRIEVAEGTMPGGFMPVIAPGKPAPALRLPAINAYVEPKDGIPLPELVSQRQIRAPSERRRRADSTPAKSKSSPTTDVERLNRANRRLKREVSKLQKSRRGPWPAIRFIVLATAIFAVGIICGSLANERASSESALIFMTMVEPVEPAKPVAAYDRSSPPADQDLRDAREMLRAAREHLVRRDINGALRLLRLCVEIADLPACHRELGTILTLIRDPAARTHYRRYIEVRPDAPDAKVIRRALNLR
ncbi:MAG: hypothetical protein AAFV29_13095, partial [Myxococcota bacterium]